MRNRVGVILFLAVFSGLAAAFLAFRFLRQPANAGPVQATETPSIEVAVAARDLPAGHLIQQNDLRTVGWPAGSLPQGYARDVNEVVGRGLIAPVFRNEPILASKIANPEFGSGLQLAVQSGMRAIAMRVNEVIGVAGWLHAGMRVDVLVTLDQGAQIDEPITQIVVQDIEVLRLGQFQQTNDQNEAVMVTVATLLANPEEAQKLTLAETKGQIRLVLRNPMDRDTVDIPGIRAEELVTGRRIVRSGGTRVIRPTTRSIEIIRGTNSQTETVSNSGGGGQ